MDQDLEIPNWHILKSGLESLLYEYNLDLSLVGATRRLDTGLAETILYHIFLKIDPRDVRKKFRNLYPNRTPEKKKLFGEKAVQFITEKELYPARVSTGLLTAGGGAPFRRLLGHLIKKAADKEIELLVNRHSLKEEPPEDAKEANQKLLERQRASVENANLALIQLEQRVNKINSLKRDILVKWEDLARNFFNLDPVPPFDETQFKLVYERFQAAIERGRAQFKILTELAQQEEADPSYGGKSKNYASRKSKRISELLYQLRHKLDEEESASSAETSTKRIFDRFHQYDHNMRGLLYDCEKAVESAEDDLLKKPEFMEKFKLFEAAIPKVEIKPIFASDHRRPNYTLLEKTLRKHLNSSGYKVDEVVDYARELHQQSGV